MYLVKSLLTSVCVVYGQGTSLLRQLASMISYKTMRLDDICTIDMPTLSADFDKFSIFSNERHLSIFSIPVH